jgi:hypothetical protein
VALDRVVCCYPSWERLLDAALGHAERCLALSYPRDAWYVRLGMTLEKRPAVARAKHFPNVRASDNAPSPAGTIRSRSAPNSNDVIWWNTRPSWPGATLAFVRRFVLAVLVGLLTFSASGVSSLVVSEPCTGYELPGSDDGACPPTCVTCRCCAQAVEPVIIVFAISPDVRVADVASFLPDLLRTTSRDILHVPKLPLL